MIEFEVATPYYYRPAELSESLDEKPESYRTLARSTLYRFSGMSKAENILVVPKVEKPSLKLKIINGFNPPLKVKSIKLRWPKQNVYFVPEPGQSYSLYFHNPFSPKPFYDLEKAIPQEQLLQFQVLSVEAPLKNASYQSPKEGNKEKAERWGLMAVVLTLIGLASLWIYRLLRQISKNEL